MRPFTSFVVLNRYALRPLVCSLALAAGCGPAAHAFSLGDLRGVAVVGRALDVRVELRADPAETLQASCLRAEVYDADTLQGPPTLEVVASAPARYTLHVRARQAVSEPVVSLVLQSTCGEPVTRRYTLLAEFAQTLRAEPNLASLPLSAPAAAPIAAPGQPAAPAASAAAQSAQSPRDAAQTSSPLNRVRPSGPSAATPAVQQTQPALAAKTATPKLAPSSAPPSSKKRSPKGAAAAPTPTVARKPSPGAPVLRLDPLDVLSDRIDLIDTSKLFEPSVDALKQQQEVSALRKDLQALRTLSSRHEARISALQTELAAAHSAQWPAWVLPLLALVSVISLVGVGVLGYERMRSRLARPHWWQAGGEDAGLDSVTPTQWMGRSTSSAGATLSAAAPAVGPSPSTPAAAAIPPAAPPAAQPVATASPETAAGPATQPPGPAPQQASEVDIDLDKLLPDAAHAQAQPAGAAQAAQPVQQSVLASIGAQSAHDVRQQTEFLMSLGEADHALAALKAYHLAHPDQDPEIGLDWLTLAHQLGQKAEFAAASASLSARYALRLPSFARFNREGALLERYDEVIASLCSLWPGSQARAFVNLCLRRDPALSDQLEFDLAAFRDLLLLRAVLTQFLGGAPDAALGLQAPRRSAGVELTQVPVSLTPAEAAPPAPAPAPEPPGRAVPLVDVVPALRPDLPPLASQPELAAPIADDPAPIDDVPSLWADLASLSLVPAERPAPVAAGPSSDLALDLGLPTLPQVETPRAARDATAQVEPLQEPPEPTESTWGQGLASLLDAAERAQAAPHEAADALAPPESLGQTASAPSADAPAATSGGADAGLDISFDDWAAVPPGDAALASPEGQPDAPQPPADAALDPMLSPASLHPESDAPLPVAPTRYATRARFPLGKKS